MKHSKLLRATAVSVVHFALTVPAWAAFTPIDIESFTNADLRTYTNGANYPIAPATLTVGGVPFNLVPFGAKSNSLGIVQDPGTAAPKVIADVALHVVDPTTVYTLMNSAFGVSGTDIATVQFVGAGGASATFDLTEGVNIRDHFNGSFNNNVTDPAIVTQSFSGGVRLDRQTFVLPSSFASDTLTHIIFTGHGSGSPQGEAFLAAATVVTSNVIPEPSALALLITGLVMLGAWRRTGTGRGPFGPATP